MNRDNASRLARPYIRLALFVQRKVPTHNRASPILEHSGEDRRPFTPIHLEIRAGNDRATLRPLRMLIGEGVVYSRHGVDAAGIGMPRNAVHVAVYPRLAQLV